MTAKLSGVTFVSPTVCNALEEPENSGCQGDSGGPLAYQDPADGVWYLIGNTSWGSSNCQVSMP